MALQNHQNPEISSQTLHRCVGLSLTELWFGGKGHAFALGNLSGAEIKFKVLVSCCCLCFVLH